METIDLDFLAQQIAVLDNWLLDPKVFSGGVVAGSLDESHCLIYTYPEISGYYLSYLSYLKQNDRVTADLDTHIKNLICYQTQLWGNIHPPATRHYSNKNQTSLDWRNRGLFIFDIAMLLRGIADAAEYKNESENLAQQILTYLNLYFDAEKLAPVHWYTEYPSEARSRWSTSSGAYQLKVIAALKRFAQVWNNNSILERIAPIQTALVSEFNRANFALHNTHSTAYALEGALLLGSQAGIDWTLGKKVILNLVSAIDNASVDQIEYRRSDAIAQLLRLSCCEPFANASLADHLYDLLCSTLNSDGSLEFTLAPCNVRYKNTWPVLFARQALDFYQYLQREGKAITIVEARCLY